MRTTIAVVAIVLLGLPVAGCSARRPIVDQEVTGLDKKYSTFAWGEQGKIAEFYVGTRATRDRGEDPYFPLEIAVVNRGRVRWKLHHDAEPFTFFMECFR